LFRFEQTIVGVFEVFALDVKAGEGQALASGFISLFLRGADFT